MTTGGTQQIPVTTFVSRRVEESLLRRRKTAFDTVLSLRTLCRRVSVGDPRIPVPQALQGTQEHEMWVLQIVLLGGE